MLSVQAQRSLRLVQRKEWIHLAMMPPTLHASCAVGNLFAHLRPKVQFASVLRKDKAAVEAHDPLTSFPEMEFTLELDELCR